jgi:transcription antitermination factor NusG
LGQVMRELCPSEHFEPGAGLLPWFALAVKTLHEHTVAECLQFKDFEAYLPVFRSSRRWSDRIKTIEQPVFPGYVFCRLNYSHRLDVLKTPGVRSIVSFGGEVTSVSDLEIEQVRLMLSAGHPVERWPFLKTGQRVRVHAGPFTGIEGLLVEVRDSYRVVISLELLQRSVAVQIDPCSIAPLSN